jgi:hypothetical protein
LIEADESIVIVGRIVVFLFVFLDLPEERLGFIKFLFDEITITQVKLIFYQLIVRKVFGLDLRKPVRRFGISFVLEIIFSQIKIDQAAFVCLVVFFEVAK